MFIKEFLFRLSVHHIKDRLKIGLAVHRFGTVNCGDNGNETGVFIRIPLAISLQMWYNKAKR